MQEQELKFAREVGKLVKRLRKEYPKKYVIFCDENGIAPTTLDTLEKGISSPKFYTVLRIIGALGISCEEFGKLVDKEISSDLYTLK
ncbi:MAG: helix-turn-helix transcriptional regulator [bacterium]|nr:helix-turn-helix transcriptional regulator [bacterium]